MMTQIREIVQTHYMRTSVTYLSGVGVVCNEFQSYAECLASALSKVSVEKIDRLCFSRAGEL
jgi:hypothetical protein